MILKNIRLCIVVLSLMPLANFAVAQSNEQYGAVVLRGYYSDLYLAFSQYGIDDVPFQEKLIQVQRNDSLLELAKRNHLTKLDSFHLAAALYEANAHLFAEGNHSHFNIGTTIKMPSVGDIFYAQTRYENLKVVDDNLVFTNTENQMRNGHRQPFSEPGSMIGPLAGEPLPGNPVAGNRRDTIVASAESRLPPLSRTQRTNYIADTQLLADGEVEPAKLVSSESASDAAAKPQMEADTNELSLVAVDPAIDVQTGAENTVAFKPNASQDSAVSSQELIAKLDATRHKVIEIPNASVATAAAAVEPALAIGASFAATDNLASDSYLGPPRNSSAPSLTGNSFDPLSSIVEWKFDGEASVGSVISQLAEYVGYELIITDHSVQDTFSRRLPGMQRTVSGITAEDGFSMLAGRGLETVFDHVARSVVHRPKGDVAPNKKSASIEVSASVKQFVQASGIASMLRQIPTDIVSAAAQHAHRCDSSVSSQQIGATQLYNAVTSRLQQKTPEPVARYLVDWYQSPTGRKVLDLEKQQIDDAIFERFSMKDSRTDRIKQIYENTVTGKGIATVAVEIDHAGWSLSGCMHDANASGDEQKISQEIAHGQAIKKKEAKLESLLREDMLLSLAYQFTSLTERELTEYANVITEHAVVYSQLEQSIVDAIALETKGVLLSSLD